MAHPYNIISYNVENCSTLGGLISILKIEMPDIVFLQELTITEEQLNLSLNNLGYKGEVNIDLLNKNKPGTG